MASDREAQIREKAYRLWQDEGEPHGRHDEHWSRAERDIGEADVPASDEPIDQASSSATTPAAGDEAAAAGVTGDDAAPVTPQTPVAVPGGMMAGAETPVPSAKPKRAAKPATVTKATGTDGDAATAKKPVARRKRTT